MAFRADESAKNGFEAVKNDFIPRKFNMDERERAENALYDIVDSYGPVVDAYPSWHPLVTHHDERYPETIPSNRCGYRGLDHTRCFVNAFISCPYGDGQEILDSVDNLPPSSFASISAKRLDVKLYNSETTPILVYCEWDKPIPLNRMIPAPLALPLLLQKELPGCEWAEVGETWETMRSYFLGRPHGARSSLFVDQDTALTMKKVWNLLLNTGMFGTIKVMNQR
jgi:hypothetical protein